MLRAALSWLDLKFLSRLRVVFQYTWPLFNTVEIWHDDNKSLPVTSDDSSSAEAGSAVFGFARKPTHGRSRWEFRTCDLIQMLFKRCFDS